VCQVQRAGFDGTSRAGAAIGIDGVRAAMGPQGLIGFTIMIWRFLHCQSDPADIIIASLAWLAISFLAWADRFEKVDQN